MTVVVAFLCTDGVVIAADSMLTPSMGNMAVGHHHGKKVDLISGNQIFAYAGDQGQAARFRAIADGSSGQIGQAAIPLLYPMALTQTVFQQFSQTGIWDQVGANAVLGFLHNNQHCCCAFMGKLQPMMLDGNHYYCALGSGKLPADPFLRFLTDTFCPQGQPTVATATLLAVWVVQHVIDTNPGGVAGPITAVAISRDADGAYIARELEADEIAQHGEAINSGREALRSWRNNIANDGVAGDPMPVAPAAIPDIAQA